MSCESLGVKGKIGVDSGEVEWKRGRGNWWCRGEMVRYEEEVGLGREVSGL